MVRGVLCSIGPIIILASNWQMSERKGVCSRADAHNHQKVQYICLEESCELSRLLCKSCITESHRKHKVGIIDKLIPPLSRLSMNSHHPHSQQDYAFFDERVMVIIDEWEKMNQMFIASMQALNNGVLMQLRAIMRTFSSEQVDRAHDLMLEGDADLAKVNEYVHMINFLDKAAIEDVEDVRKYTNHLTKNVISAIRKGTEKIKVIMDRMITHIKSLDFNSQTYLRRHSQENNDDIKEEERLKDESKFEESKIDDKPKKEETKRTDLRSSSKVEIKSESKSKDAKKKEESIQKKLADRQKQEDNIVSSEEDDDEVRQTKKQVVVKKESDPVKRHIKHK